MHRIVVYHVGPFRFQAIFTRKITYVSRQRILYFRFVFCFVFFSSHLRPKSCPPSGRTQEGLIFQVVCLRRYPAIWEEQGADIGWHNISDMVTSHLCLLRFSLCCYLVHGCLHLKKSTHVVMNLISSTGRSSASRSVHWPVSGELPRKFGGMAYALFTLDVCECVDVNVTIKV